MPRKDDVKFIGFMQKKLLHMIGWFLTNGVRTDLVRTDLKAPII